MRTLRIIAVVAPLALLGCRTDPNQVLLEQESRILEDRVYQLEAMLDDAQAARESTIRENAALKKELAGGERGPGSDFGSRSSTGSGGNGGFQPPSIELPSEDSGPPPKARGGGGEAPPLEAPSIELPESSDIPPAELTPGDKQAVVAEGEATKIVINKRLTGGLDRDGSAGDEGILVVVEPRNEKGELVKSPGAVSVVVMDPAQEGEGARVARWDFEVGEVSSHFYNTIFGRGLQFELPWPAEPPKHRNLRLFVRYTTINGKKIVAEAPIDVRTPPEQVSRDREASRPANQQRAENSRPADQQRAESSRRTRPTNSRLKSRGDDGGEAPRASEDPQLQPARRGDSSPRQAELPAWRPYR